MLSRKLSTRKEQKMRFVTNKLRINNKITLTERKIRI